MRRSFPDWLRLSSLSLLFAGASCDASSNTPSTTMDMSQASPDAPRIISIGTNVSELTDGESVRFVAVVTDPAGIQNLVGGQLTSADGNIKYGAFVASQQGAYSLDLSWAQISQTDRLGFASELKRTFVAEFYNVLGLRTSASIELRFHCRGEPACDGRCLSTGTLCPGTTDKLCIAGACQSGCYVAQEFVADGSASTKNACQVCRTATSKTSLQTLSDYAVCKPGLACGSGVCEVPFAKQDPKLSFTTLNAVSAASSNFQIAVGTSGAMTRTTDGGANWVGGSVGSDTLRGVFALSATEVYAVGSSGALQRTIDGGNSWTKQAVTPTPVTSTLYGVWASGPNDVWAVGAGGTVLRTTNGGTTWTKITTPTTTGMNAVWGSDANNVYFVGDSGTIWRTTNSGATITPIASNVTSTLSGVWGSSANDVYVVGASGTVLRSTNNGASFAKLTTPDSSSLNGVWGSSENSVYFIGSGVVWRTANGGAVTVVPSGTYSTFYGISGTAENAFTIVGSSLVLRKL